MRGFSAPLHPSDTIIKTERPATSKRGRPLGRRNSSRGATFVPMMQTARLRERDDLACREWLYAARLRTILVEREMRPGIVMVLNIPRQDAAQVMLVKDDDVIQTFAADRADEALDIWILPR